MIACEKEIINGLSAAKEAVLLAGKFLSEYRPSSKKIHKDSGHDIKITADFRAERIILDYLKKNSEFSILSEEKGLWRRKNEKFTWIVDPLDGSFNYSRGIPVSCVSIGLWRKNHPVLGIVYDFNRSEVFTGIPEKGAWLNDKPIRVNSTSQKEKAVLCTGFPVNTDFSQEGIIAFTKKVRSYKKIRLLGSAAISMAYVACGRADVYHEKDIMFWDIAGGVPILLGAGGKLNMEKTANKYSYNVYVSNGFLSRKGR